MAYLGLLIAGLLLIIAAKLLRLAFAALMMTPGEIAEIRRDEHARKQRAIFYRVRD